MRGQELGKVKNRRSGAVAVVPTGAERGRRRNRVSKTGAGSTRVGGAVAWAPPGALNVMARLLRALRGLALREAPGWTARGRADCGGLRAGAGSPQAGRPRRPRPHLPAFDFCSLALFRGPQPAGPGPDSSILRKLRRGAPARPPPAI